MGIKLFVESFIASILSDYGWGGWRPREYYLLPSTLSARPPAILVDLPHRPRRPLKYRKTSL